MFPIPASDLDELVEQHAPVWMRKTGLEWLYRVAQEPK
ncbi:MAG: WecB/TagA/CpsF family glycosyltransferase, partial [bacterium]